MNDKLYEKIGYQIRQKRKAKRLTGETMGRLLGVTKSAYSYYERGLSKLSIDDLMKICAILDLDWVAVVEEATKGRRN